jgi:uncharacterized protein (TIGR02246 family)
MATQGTPQDEEALQGLGGRFTTAWNANDASALGQLVTEDFQEIRPDGTSVTGRAAFEQAEAAGMKERQAMKLTMTLATTRGYLRWINAEHAVLAGTWTATGAPPGSPGKGSWIVVARKDPDGQWRIANSLAADYMPPPTAGAGGS